MSSRRVQRSLAVGFFTGLGIFATLLVAACAPGSVTSLPTATATATEERVAALQAEAKDLAVVWKAWTALLEAYDGQDGLDRSKALEGAVMAMLDTAQVRPYPFLTELPFVKENPATDVPAGLEDVWKTWRLLRAHSPETSTRSLADAAAGGLAQGLNDPHAGYYPPDEYTETRADQSGTYYGIGARVDESATGIVITHLFAGSPAEKSGLKPGDIITAANGVSIKGFTSQQAVNLIRGPEGSEVILTIEREGAQAPLEVSVFRGKVNVPSVAARELPGKVYYLYIHEFTNDTGREIREALQGARDNGGKAFILDLRDNPGGTVTGAVAVASQFLSNGLVMYEIDTDGKRRDHAVQDGGLATGVPLAVVVNASSASAAEVVAGAIQDHKRGIVFGQQTYGKGSVQVFRELGNGSAMRVTVARWYTPGGRQIQDVGITPDTPITLGVPKWVLAMPGTEQQVMLDSQLEAAYLSLLDKLGLSIQTFGQPLPGS